MQKTVRAVYLTMLAMIGGCASYPVNARLGSFNPESGYRFSKLVPNPETNPDDNPDPPG